MVVRPGAPDSGEVLRDTGDGVAVQRPQPRHAREHERPRGSADAHARDVAHGVQPPARRAGPGERSVQREAAAHRLRYRRRAALKGVQRGERFGGSGRSGAGCREHAAGEEPAGARVDQPARHHLGSVRDVSAGAGRDRHREEVRDTPAAAGPANRASARHREDSARRTSPAASARAVPELLPAGRRGPGAARRTQVRELPHLCLRSKPLLLPQRLRGTHGFRRHRHRQRPDRGDGRADTAVPRGLRRCRRSPAGGRRPLGVRRRRV